MYEELIYFRFVMLTLVNETILDFVKNHLAYEMKILGYCRPWLLNLLSRERAVL